MNTPRHLFFLLCLFIASASIALAQVFVAEDTLPNRYGIMGAAQFNQHAATFTNLPDVPDCCPGYTKGNGIGPSFGALVEFPFSRKYALDLRATFAVGSAALVTDEGTWLNDANNVLTHGTFRHTIDATLTSIGVEPIGVLHLFGALSLEAGVRAAYVLQKNFSQKEEIIEPANTGTFVENGQRTRNTVTSVIPGASAFDVSLLAGLRYELPLNASRSLVLAPEVMYFYAVTPVASGMAWHANALRTGVTILYTPQRPPPVIEVLSPAPQPVEPPPKPAPPVVIEPVVSPKPSLTATLAVTGVEANGLEATAATIRVEEFISTTMRPLLPYVFFDEKSARIPARYVLIASPETDRFRIDALHGLATLQVYRHVLNIIGRRLRDYPSESITLIGCNADRGAERGNRPLSTNRANAVRDYLHSVWGIAESRMNVTARDLPATPSNPDSTYGMEENRRVEIHSDAWNIIEPVVTHDTLRTATPPVIRFRSTSVVEAGAAAWTLRAMQQTALMKRLDAEGDVPAMIDWKIDAEKESIPHAPIPLEASLEISDHAGQTFTARSAPLPIDQITLARKKEQRVADRTIDEYSLILFDFDKAELGPTNKRLCKFISEGIRPASTVSIAGYSDHYGEAAHNATLSQERAVAVAKSLGVTGARVEGRGDGSALFPNDTPEGRLYCRTVNVEVQTPVK